jgi:hypothetical protein
MKHALPFLHHVPLRQGASRGYLVGRMSDTRLIAFPKRTRQKTRTMAQMPVGRCSGKHSRQPPANNWKPIRKPVWKPYTACAPAFWTRGQMSRGPARFKQSDVARAMKGAKNAGVDVRVEIVLDGKMSIIPVKGDDPPKTNEWDEALATPKAKVHS